MRVYGGLTVQGPTVPVSVTQQVVGFRAVGDAAGGAVVFDLPADAIGHQAEQHHFNHVAGVTEVAGSFEAALAGVDPFLLEILDGRQQRCFAPGFVIGHVGRVPLWQERARLEIGHQTAARPLEEHPVIYALQADGAMRGIRHGTALIPRDLDGGTPIIGRDIKMRFQFDGDDLGIERITLALGRGWEAGFNSVPGQVHGVAAHVAHLAAAPVPMHVPMKAPPLEVFRVVGVKRRWSEPEIVIDVTGRIAFGGR